MDNLLADPSFSGRPLVSMLRLEAFLVEACRNVFDFGFAIRFSEKVRFTPLRSKEASGPVTAGICV